MKTIKILFSQIVISEKIIEVPNDEYDSLILDNEDVSDFIWNNMTEQEKNWTDGKKWLENAIDCGYVGVRKI